MSPRTAEQWDQIRDQSRERLIETALSLFAQHGYAATSIRMIARSAEVSQGLLYNYFASKEALLQAIFERSMNGVSESFIVSDFASPPQAQLQELITQALTIVRRNDRFWRLWYSLRFQPEVLAGLTTLIDDWIALINAELERRLEALGVTNPALEARLLFAQIDGVAQHATLSPAQYPLEAVIQAIVARYAPLETPDGTIF